MASMRLLGLLLRLVLPLYASAMLSWATEPVASSAMPRFCGPRLPSRLHGRWAGSTSGRATAPIPAKTSRGPQARAVGVLPLLRSITGRDVHRAVRRELIEFARFGSARQGKPGRIGQDVVGDMVRGLSRWLHHRWAGVLGLLSRETLRGCCLQRRCNP